MVIEEFGEVLDKNVKTGFIRDLIWSIIIIVSDLKLSSQSQDLVLNLVKQGYENGIISSYATIRRYLINKRKVQNN